MKKRMQNVEQLRNILLYNFELVTDGSMEKNQSKELSNIAGKTLQSLSLQMKYQQAKGLPLNIPFLDC